MTISLASDKLEKGTDEWRKARIKEIAADFYVYCDKNLKIRDKDGAITPLVLNSVQRKFVAMVLTELSEGRPVRFIILKARQMGLSTVIEALIFWYTATHKNISATIVAHLDDAARNIYEMFRRYYDNAETIFQPKLKYNTKKDLTFEVIGSTIMTGSAESKEIGRSRTNQIIHNSEVAFWSNGQELVAGLMQTVPMRPNTMVFNESTANGIGGYFYETWQAAKRGDSVFTPVFFAWFDSDEYRMPVPQNGITLSDAERAMKDEYDLDDEQLMWYRMKLREFGNDTERMRQEYPSNDMEAFIASGRPRFHIPTLLEMEKGCVAGQQGEVVQGQFEWQFLPLERAPLEVFKEPERTGQYVIGADVAEGLAHGDYSVAQVINRRTREQVARMRIHCDPDVFGDKLYELGMYYNQALIGTEVNNHGLTTIQRLKDREYPNLYQRESGYDRAINETSASMLGWKTDSRTKPLMIDYAATAIRERSLTIFDITTIREHMTYVIDDNGRTNAQEGCFDDCVIALAIALQMFEWSFTSPNASIGAYHRPEYRH